MGEANSSTQEIEIKDMNKKELLELKATLEEKISECNATIGSAQATIENIELKESYGSDNAEDAKEKKESFKRLKKFQEVLSRLSGELKTVEESLKKLTNFDKRLTFRNIRYLVKNNPNVKIGQIENEAQVRPGYMARLEREDNLAAPSIEFIVSAAKMLGISLDVLTGVDLEGMTDNEEFTMRFVEKVFMDTKNKKIDWLKEGKEFYRGGPAGPPFDVDLSAILKPDPMDDYVSFESYIYPNSSAEVVDTAYHGKISEDGNELYILRVDYKMEEKQVRDVNYELVLTGKRNVGLCSTLEVNEALFKQIDTLYKYIENALAHVQICTEARSIMEKYLSRE